MEAVPTQRDRPVLCGALLAAGLLIILVIWFGRACWGGWWIADRTHTVDTYMLATVYDRWASQVGHGHLPLWFPEFAGGGHSVHAGWMYGLFYPPIALFLALPTESAWTWLAILHVVFGALGMYAFLWDERRDVAAAAAGAVVFALSGFMLGRVLCGHLNLVMPFAWAPWALRAAARTARGVSGSAAWLGICAGVGMLAGHAQVWFYVAPIVAAYAVIESRRPGASPGAAPRLLLGAALALGIAAIQWIPAAELFAVSGHPPEKPDLVELCSAPVARLLAQIAPRFAETPPTEPDKTFMFRHEYVGLAGPLAVAAALLALRLRDGRRWFWFAVLAFGLLLAMGVRNDASRLANELPPFRWARAPGRAMTLVVLAGSVLAGHLVADWCGALAARWRALVPAAFVASALVCGVPAPDTVRKDFYDHDWTTALSSGVAGHRVHVLNARYPFLERFGISTLRDVVPVDTPGYKALTAEGTSSRVASWWLDVAELLAVMWREPPADERATAALSTKTQTFEARGPATCFAQAVATSDEDALVRLRAGARDLFLPERWASTEQPGSPTDDVTVAPRASPEEISFQVTGGARGWVLLASKWYPGWRETGGADVACGNLAFLTVSLDGRASGEYRLVYRPWWRIPALAASIVSLVAAFSLLLRQLRRAPASG